MQRPKILRAENDMKGYGGRGNIWNEKKLQRKIMKTKRGWVGVKTASLGYR
jgi:hypothetical protein